ncbi:hypothetical protein ACFUEN_41355 [Streptomyces griseorubiginosus]|uniref:hypothetical protein n=1 Tax=Streptomyces griseorubiginosus TaxID=67304 RepID=UPI00363EADE2
MNTHVPDPIHHARSYGATTTVPCGSDNAYWAPLVLIATCVIGAEPLAAVLDSATQLVTVVIVLLLVRSQLKGQPPTAVEASRQVGH